MSSMPSQHAPDTFQLEDDIDALFNRMDELELPEGLAARILTNVEHLTTDLLLGLSMQQRWSYWIEKR